MVGLRWIRIVLRLFESLSFSLFSLSLSLYEQSASQPASRLRKREESRLNTASHTCSGTGEGEERGGEHLSGEGERTEVRGGRLGWRQHSIKPDSILRARLTPGATCLYLFSTLVSQFPIETRSSSAADSFFMNAV